MIRQRTPLIISLIIHFIFFILIFLGYEAITTLLKNREVVEEKKVCVQLCTISNRLLNPTKPLPKVKKTEKKIVKKLEKKVTKVQKIEKKKSVVAKKQQPIEKKIEKLPPKNVEKLVEKITNIETKREAKVKEEESKQVKSPNLEQEYIDENIQKIRELIIENLYYPRSARKRGIVGEVVVAFKLLKSAEVTNIIIISSEKNILSRAAKKTLENLSFEFPKPKKSITLHVPIMYQLN